MNRLAKASLVSVCLSISAIVASGQTQRAPQKSVVDGWDKAKFGMTLEEVVNSYPQSKKVISSYRSRDCWDKAEPGKQPEPDVIAEWRNDGPQDLGCEDLELEAVLGDGTADIKFRFLLVSGKLVEIEIVPRSSSENVYDAYKRGLQDRFGQGKELVLDRTQEMCSELAKRLSSGAKVYGYELGLPGTYYTWSAGNEDRQVTMTFRRSALCTEILNTYTERQKQRFDGRPSHRVLFADLRSRRPTAPKF
jgi:hypothetical protein